MPILTPEAAMMTMQDAIALPDCQPAADAYGWRYPCGLGVYAEGAGGAGGAGGAAWPAIQWVHERHHRECGPQAGLRWSIVCHQEQGDNWVKLTFDCKWNGKH